MKQRPNYSKPKINRFKTIGYISGFIILAILVIFSVNEILNSQFLGVNWRTYIVFHTNPTVVVSFAKQKNDDNLIFLIPDETLIDVPFGYGQYQLGAVWNLAQMEKNGQIYADSISDLIETPISGWIGKGESLYIENNSVNQTISTLNSNFAFTKIFTRRNLTNLSIFDQILLWWSLVRFDYGNSQMIDLTKSSDLISDSQLPDATKIKLINALNWQNVIQEKEVDTQIRQESLSVEIKNSTDASGIGQKFAQILSNQGCKIISIGSSSENIKNCQINIDQSKLKTKTIKWLNKFFPCTLNIHPGITSGPDITIIIGQKFADRWSN